MTFTTDQEIHLALQLPECPHNLVAGLTPAASKNQFVTWLDEIIRINVQAGVDVCDRDGLGRKVPGSYSGLRSGEWSKVIQALTTPELNRWNVAMFDHVPILSCGKLKVVDGIAGRGNNTSSFPAVGPFH